MVRIYKSGPGVQDRQKVVGHKAHAVFNPWRSIVMNPLIPRGLLACTIATVMLVAACASPSSNREGTPVSVEQTKQALSGEWVSLAPEIRPSATKNPDG